MKSFQIQQISVQFQCDSNSFSGGMLKHKEWYRAKSILGSVSKTSHAEDNDMLKSMVFSQGSKKKIRLVEENKIENGLK